MVDREQYDLAAFASFNGIRSVASVRIGWSDLNYLADSVRFDR